jgi:hypothetical protein
LAGAFLLLGFEAFQVAFSFIGHLAKDLCSLLVGDQASEPPALNHTSSNVSDHIVRHAARTSPPKFVTPLTPINSAGARLCDSEASFQ